ncbi:MAG: VOC family protein [Bacteroidota bacterium]
MEKGKITGIGGLFFKSKDPDKLKQWYTETLGLETDQYGKSFKWRDYDDPDKTGLTQWSIFSADTKYFDPCKNDYMFNYRVDDLEAFLAKVKAKGVEQVGEMEVYDYGKFAWILDADGNKMELWEPVDGAFED